MNLFQEKIVSQLFKRDYVAMKIFITKCITKCTVMVHNLMSDLHISDNRPMSEIDAIRDTGPHMGRLIEFISSKSDISFKTSIQLP